MSANDRIQWFHKMVSEGCYPNSWDIADKFDISQRQAQRDIEHMKATLSAPLEYCKSHKGYFYRSPFYLPAMIRTENQSDYSNIIAGIKDFTESSARVSAVQMQLPYSAVLEITDKMHHRYRCEFPSIELFLGVIMSTGAEIRIVSPSWLREKLVDFAKKILKCNDDIQE